MNTDIIKHLIKMTGHTEGQVNRPPDQEQVQSTHTAEPSYSSACGSRLVVISRLHPRAAQVSVPPFPLPWHLQLCSSSHLLPAIAPPHAPSLALGCDSLLSVSVGEA